jgi:hypothetical protein
MAKIIAPAPVTLQVQLDEDSHSAVEKLSKEKRALLEAWLQKRRGAR